MEEQKEEKHSPRNIHACIFMYFLSSLSYKNCSSAAQSIPEGQSLDTDVLPAIDNDVRCFTYITLTLD